VLTEGQAFAGEYTSVERTPPIGGAPVLRFTVSDIEPRRERGEAVHLSAHVLFDVPGGAPLERVTRVNAPARWGAATLLVNEAGLSPVLWLQDSEGFSLDRVAVPVRATPGSLPTEVPLADGLARARIFPLEPEDPFPDRGSLARTAVRVELLPAEAAGKPLFDGLLRPGQAAEVSGLRLILAEMRFWVKVQVVVERGGGLLVSGFLLGILGLAWRLFLYRREVLLSWDTHELRLVGRSEYFSQSFHRELERLRGALESESAAERSRRDP